LSGVLVQLVQVSIGGEPCTIYCIDTFVPLISSKVTLATCIFVYFKYFHYILLITFCYNNNTVWKVIVLMLQGHTCSGNSEETGKCQGCELMNCFMNHLSLTVIGFILSYCSGVCMLFSWQSIPLLFQHWYCYPSQQNLATSLMLLGILNCRSWTIKINWLVIV
jgi:hypothetical protein